jgi:hypothetical protein
LAARFGGIALMQLGNVAEHISDQTLPADLWLSLVSGSLVLVVSARGWDVLPCAWKCGAAAAARDPQSSETAR